MSSTPSLRHFILGKFTSTGIGTTLATDYKILACYPMSELARYQGMVQQLSDLARALCNRRTDHAVSVFIPRNDDDAIYLRTLTTSHRDSAGRAVDACFHAVLLSAEQLRQVDDDPRNLDTLLARRMEPDAVLGAPAVDRKVHPGATPVELPIPFAPTHPLASHVLAEEDEELVSISRSCLMTGQSLYADARAMPCALNVALDVLRQMRRGPDQPVVAWNVPPLDRKSWDLLFEGVAACPKLVIFSGRSDLSMPKGWADLAYVRDLPRVSSPRPAAVAQSDAPPPAPVLQVPPLPSVLPPPQGSEPPKPVSFAASAPVPADEGIGRHPAERSSEPVSPPARRPMVRPAEIHQAPPLTSPSAPAPAPVGQSSGNGHAKKQPAVSSFKWMVVATTGCVLMLVTAGIGLVHQQRIISARDESIKAKDYELAGLRTQGTGNTTFIAELRKQIGELKTEVTRLQGQKDADARSIASLHSDVSASNQQINTCNQSLAASQERVTLLAAYNTRWSDAVFEILYAYSGRMRNLEQLTNAVDAFRTEAIETVIERVELRKKVANLCEQFPAPTDGR